jgi:hypothetical protein
VQSQQLPTKSQVFEDEVLTGTESAGYPAEELSERHDHGKNLAKKAGSSFAPSHSFRRCTTFWRGTSFYHLNCDWAYWSVNALDATVVSEMQGKGRAALPFAKSESGRPHKGLAVSNG